MRLERLRIDMLPGIEPGFEVRLPEQGVTLVTGPNGVGKSSLVRAIRWLLSEPRRGDPSALALEADWRGATSRFSVRRQGRAIDWKRDGESTAAPALPGEDQWHAYWMSMESLLAADTGDERLNLELKRLMAGGLDLAEIRRLCQFNQGPRHGMNEARELREARQELQRVGSEYDSLRREELRLPRWQQDLDQARRAGRQVERLDLALAWLDARDERQRREVEAREYPSGMDRLRGDEIDKLETLERRREERERALQAAVDARLAASSRLKETGLEEQGPDDEEMRHWDRTLSEVKHRLESSKRERERAETARRRRDEVAGELGVDPETRLTPEALSEAEQVAREWQSADWRVRELRAGLKEAPEEPSRAEIHVRSEGARALGEWLQAKRSVMPARWRLALAVATGGGLVALCGGIASRDAWVLGGSGLALLALGWTWLRLLGDEKVKEAERKFTDSRLDPPRQWLEEHVEGRKQELEAEVADLERRREEAAVSRARREQVAAYEKDLRVRDRQKRELADRLGFDPGIGILAMDQLVRLVKRRQDAADECIAAEVAAGSIEDEIAESRARLTEFLGRWCPGEIGEGTDWPGIELTFKRLQKRCQTASASRIEVDRAVAGEQNEREALGEISDQRRELYRSVGLEEGQVQELRQRADCWEDWNSAEKRRQEAVTAERLRREALEPVLEEDSEEGGKLREWVDEGRRGAIEQARLDAQDQAATADEMQEQITVLRTRLKEAGTDRRMEQASAGVQRAQSNLDDAFEAACEADVGSWLLEQVENDHRREHEPDVLQRARVRLHEFTHHAYRLEWDADGGFRALETAGGECRALAELSSGARMQLLLAVRLAWIEHLDRGREGLPVCLDEALTTTDEERFAAVASSLEQWSRDSGRQVLYLSARRSDERLWERAVGHPPHLIDLAKVRFGGSGVDEAIDLSLVEPDEVPSPGGMDAESYGRELGVAPVDPWSNAEQVHLFHVLRDDLSLLHRLLAVWRTDRLGPFEQLLSSEAADVAVAASEERMRLQRRIGMVRSWIELWRMGRGRKVDRPALEQSDAVTTTFMEEVVDLAAEVDGDGEKLVEALAEGKVKRFRTDARLQLEEWLRQNGYIDDQSRLDRDDRLRLLLQRHGAEAGEREVEMQEAALEAATRGSGDPG